jgi:hypothetical protein
MSCKLFPAIYIFLPFTPFLIGTFKSVKKRGSTVIRKGRGGHCTKANKRSDFTKAQIRVDF